MKRILLLTVMISLLLGACASDLPAPPETPVEATPGASLPPTDLPLPSETPSATTLPTPTLGIGSSQVSPVDGMTLLYVPAGAFSMGSEAGYSDERPVHTVSLSAFWVDQSEVTNGMYAACESAGECARPRRKSSNLIDGYYGFEGYLDYPVIFISWQDAADYCAWVGRRLPTEAEWEKAARGTDERPYPWGSAPPDATLANFNHNLDDVSRVGSYQDGKSPYGAFDLAGNVMEWTADWYAEDYYSFSPELDPPGAESGLHRVVRGGSWKGNESGVRSAHRFIQLPDSPSFDLGFRCVQDAQP